MFYLGKKERETIFMRWQHYQYFFLLAISLMSWGSLQAEYEFNRHEPKTKKNVPQKKPSTAEEKKEAKRKVADKRVVIQNVRAVIISGDDKLPPDHVLKTAKGVEFYRMSGSLSKSQKAKLKKQLQKQLVGQTMTFETLNHAKKNVRNHYVKNGQAMVIVTIPEQDVTENVIVIQVCEAKVGKIKITGNEWFTEDRLQEYVSLQEDDVIFNNVVEGDAAFMNRNPWRHVDVIYSPGEKQGTTDITFNVRDERPVRIYAGADNTGFKVTDIYRVFFGFNWANFLWLDQIISYQYTASPDFKKFQSHMAQYTVPLPNKNILNFFGGYSLIKVPRADLPGVVSKGQSLQVSGRYVYPFLPRPNDWLQDVKAGIDYKRTNNDLVVGETTLSSAYATIFQYVVAYDTSAVFGQHIVEGGVDFFLQPFALGDSMTSANYSRLRPGADTHYAYLKGGLKYNWDWSELKMAINLRSVLQFSTGTLLPMEQLGLGGFYSVRGYPERAVNVDNGWLVNFEIRSPKVSLIRPKDQKPIDAFSAIGFFDFGVGGVAKTVPNEPKSWGLAGIGPGIRYDYGNWLHARLDLGIRLTDRPFGSESSARALLYFSVVGAY